jgi:hypothetical protein
LIVLLFFFAIIIFIISSFRKFSMPMAGVGGFFAAELFLWRTGAVGFLSLLLVAWVRLHRCLYTISRIVAGALAGG